MRAGFALGNIGPIGTAENLVRIAQRAEALGYDTLWAVERLLWPLKPQTPYPVTPDGSLPAEYKHVLDPLEALTFVAAHTRRIGLGTSVLDIPYYNPVMLARRVSTLDVLSGGRVRLGLGLGWSKDEHDAMGAEMKNRGAKADEFLAVVKTIWTTDPTEFRGQYYTLPRSHIGPKPAQKPHPPIYLAAFAAGALNRIGRLADGWNPVAIPVAGMKQMFDSVKQTARDAGRDPSRLQLVVRANIEIHDKPRATDGAIFTGTLAQIEEDVAACRALGAHEVHFDPTFTAGGQQIDRWLALMEQLRKLV
ncbi:MAG TPA: LLM class F420-dependent oxidoreductase [Methylomirabilota bacterium]|nr:LLM class F420-dependent oxidoreductase [Methylomirabilota bacterium]